MGLRLVALAIILWGLQAVAAPKTPTKAEAAEIQALEHELRALQLKQASFAAAKVARTLYEVQRKASGDDAPVTAQRRAALAAALTMIGEYAEAAVLYREALVAAEKAHGAMSREVQWALAPLISVAWAQNRLDEVDPPLQRSLAITKQLDGERSLPYAQALLQYATLLNIRNEYSAAQRLYEQSVQLQEALGPTGMTQLTLTSSLQMLAALYWQTNQHPRAIALYNRVIAMTQAMPNATVFTRAATLSGIAAMYHYGARDDLAAPLTKQVIELYTNETARLEKDSPADPQLSAMYGQLGFTYRQNGDLANAEKNLVRAVAVDEKRTGYSAWTGSLADIARAEGKPKDALVLLEKTKAEMAKLSPLTATIYDSTIADVLRELGDYKRAEAMLTGYLDHTEKVYGKGHPMYGLGEQSLSHVYLAAHDLGKAERVLGDSLEIAEHELTNVLRTGTEADHAVYFARNGYLLDSAINFGVAFAPRSVGAARLGLTTLLRRKGRVLDAAAASMATIRSKLSADDKQLLDDLASARSRLAKLTVAGPMATGGGDYAKEIAVLEDQIEKLEIQVGAKSSAYRAVTQPIELASIQKLVPTDSRLVEIVNFQPSDPTAPYRLTPVLPPRRYAAYVLATKGDPVLVDLGPAAAIDDATSKFRKAVGNPKSQDVAALGHALYTLTLGKLGAALGTATEILIAPDGNLNLVPFSALVDDHQDFLIKRYTFTYLTSGRDLLRLAVKSKAQGGGVMFANPSFDVSAPPAPSATPATPATGGARGARSMDLASLSWPQLPGTGEEADQVEKAWRGFADYRGARATETALKALHGPKILHLATHGFFLNDKARPVGDGVESATYENPLLRSGLAFAGANQLSSGDDDGILTAMEASALDLWGTKLVVLSACDTGNGKVTNGEGVYGLRRALVIAGAESLVMTLWQVDDLATRDLMAGYYERLKAGRPRSAALRDIQLEIGAREKYTHPYYWASFLAAGDNSPLN